MKPDQGSLSCIQVSRVYLGVFNPANIKEEG